MKHLYFIGLKLKLLFDFDEVLYKTPLLNTINTVAPQLAAVPLLFINKNPHEKTRLQHYLHGTLLSNGNERFFFSFVNINNVFSTEHMIVVAIN